MMSVATGLNYDCEICNKSFSRKAKLSNHLRCHVVELKEEDLDGEDFDESQDLVVDFDLEAVRNETSFEVFSRNRSDMQRCRCSFCEKTFARSDLLCHHMVLSHSEEALKCKICCKVFLTQANYNFHKLEHLTRRNGGKALEHPYTGSVSRYIKLEGKEEVTPLDFKCHLCTRSFSCYTNLWSHAWVHTDEKPYVCSVCGRGFGRLYRLRYHMAFHTNSKPYKCEECGKGFKLMVFLKTHQKTVHGGAMTQRSERWSKSFVVQSKSISKVKSSDFDGKSKNCKMKKTTLISRIFKPLATRMIIESKQVCKVSKKKPKKLDHLKFSKNQSCTLPKPVVTVSRNSVKAIASRHSSKKVSLSKPSNSGIIERGIKVRNKSFKGHCADNNFACTEAFDLDSETVDLKNFVATKAGETASKTLLGITKVKRLHFRAAEKNIKLIINNESSGKELDKLLGEKSASQLRKISKTSDFASGTLVRNSKIPMHIQMQPNKENLRGNFISTNQSIVGKNMQADYGHRKMKTQVTKNKNVSCSPSKFEALFVCKVCKKSYRHKSSLNRHFKKSSHAQSNNLKIRFPKGDSYKLNFSDTRDSGNLKKRKDVKILQHLLPKVRNEATKTIVDMNLKVVQKLHEQREVLDYGSSSRVVLQIPDDEGKPQIPVDEGKPLNLSMKRSDISGKSLQGKTRLHVKAGNGGQNIGNKKVAFHPDFLQNMNHRENSDAVSSNQIGKKSNFSVEQARTYNQSVIEVHYSSEPVESASSNLKMHVNDTGKDVSLNINGNQTKADSYSEGIQKARSKTVNWTSEPFKGIDLSKNINDQVTTTCLQECDSSIKSGRPGYEMKDRVHSEVQTSSQNNPAKHSEQKVQSTKYHCQICLRKFKHAYSLKRHCLKQVCTGGRKRFDNEGGNFQVGSEKRLPLLPQEVTKGDQALITQGQQVLKTDNLLKSESYKPQVSSTMGNKASSEREQLKKIHSKLLMEACKNSLPKQCNNFRAWEEEGANRQNTEGHVSSSSQNFFVKPYKCYRCDKRYATFYFFQKHINKNSCSSYKCLFCQKKFKDRSIWEHHMKVERAVIQNKSLSCAGCKTVFCRPSDLAKHMMRNTCPRCNGECFCSYFLDLHEESGKCNTGLLGDAGGRCGCPSGSVGCQTCYNRNDEPKEETSFHLDYSYGNLIIAEDASESSDTFNNETVEANITLRKTVPSMFQDGFTSNCENSVTGEESTRNGSESQNGIRDDYSFGNGKFIVNYTGAGGGVDAFQGDNSRNGLMYGYGYFEPSAVTLQDDAHTPGVSDIDCLMPQVTNQHSLSYYSQFLNYHCHNYSSPLQGLTTEKARQFVDKGGKQANGDGKLLFSPEFFGANVSHEAVKHFLNSEQQNSNMTTNVFENVPSGSSQFRVLESIDWEGHCSTENPYYMPVPVQNATVYDVEGCRVAGNGETPNYESFAPVNVCLPGSSSNANPNLCENRHYSSHSGQ
ncbi:uncharacterized protein LOC135195511 [Macrobrachium nipponense]|uniref:uncharacterized protein LOC135195511 n=1 Tax=Macrobrachium nipponense TaxID=159736 RepID=UPI0030C863B4